MWQPEIRATLHLAGREIPIVFRYKDDDGEPRIEGTAFYAGRPYAVGDMALDEGGELVDWDAPDLNDERRLLEDLTICTCPGYRALYRALARVRPQYWPRLTQERAA